MRDNKDKSFEDEVADAHPRGLFSRIMKRLGLEKELVLIKRHLGFFTALLTVFLFLSVFAFIGIKHVMAESSFGPFVSLIFSDPGIVIKYRHSFAFAAIESVPGVATAALLFSVAFLMLFIRLAIITFEKFSITTKSINKNKYGHQ